MSLFPILAVALVVATVAVSLFTGQRLGEARKAVFQIEMQAEELRRRVSQMEDDAMRNRREARAYERLRATKRAEIEALYDELRILKTEDSRAVGVASGLQQRGFELSEAAA